MATTQSGPRLRSLGGAGWQCKGYLGEDWRWRDAHKPTTRDARFWLSAVVPGSPYAALHAAGEIPDPYFERNSLLVEWVSSRSWLYRRQFTLDLEERSERVQLVFEGVDSRAQFFLNGEGLGEQDAMFVPARFEVGERLRWGEENHLAVVLDAAPVVEPQVGRTDKVRVHKSRMAYGWDFCPRMPSIGLWDDVALRFSGPVRIEDVWARPALSGERRRAEARFDVQLDCAAAQTVEVRVEVRLAGARVGGGTERVRLEAGRGVAALAMAVDEVALWWPNGEGAQPLYEATVTVHDESGRRSDERRLQFGLRTLEWERNDTPDASARPYVAVVNGRRIYLRGWNWVPLDADLAAPQPDKLARLMTLAHAARVNLLRVWGGGLIEREAFYDACDRSGLLVWQEFAQSSSGIASQPARDADFLARMEAEARVVVPRRRNHASLALWCGGNELQALDGTPLGEDEPVLAVLGRVVQELDPGRKYLPTSPTGRVFSNRLDLIEKDPQGLHDVHGPWEHQGPQRQYELYDRGVSLLNSEFGVEGMANELGLERLIAPEHRWPTGRDNPVYFHLGAWWNNTPQVQEWFGGIDHLDPLRRASQFLQADGLRYAIEANRRRQWRNSGSLPWQFNESYPNAFCTSAVDYWGRPKPAWFAVARAYAPLVICAELGRQALAGRDAVEAKLWVIAERPLPGARLRATLFDGAGARLADSSEQVSVEVGARRLAEVRWPLPPAPAAADRGGELLVLSLRLEAGGALVASNDYLLSRGSNLAPLLRQPRTVLEVQQRLDAEAASLRVANRGAALAVFVEIVEQRTVPAAGECAIEDSGFQLLPGEERCIAVRWRGVPEAERTIRVSAMNCPPVDIGWGPS